MGVSKLPKYEMYNNICNTQHTWSEQIAKKYHIWIAPILVKLIGRTHIQYGT